jgi:Terminase RNaseH-like domain
MGAVTVGVDIGQRRDPAAIAVVEQERRSTETHHIARYLERLPLGTPYPAVAERVAAVVQGVHAATSGKAPTLYVDATGVGTPIVDVLKAAGVGGLVRLKAVYFTHGDRRKVERGEVKLGKAWLVSRMQALLQSGLLHLPRNAKAEVLGKELLDYEIRVTEDANERYGAFRVGTHDDLVTALGLATQEDRGGGEAATSFRDPYGWGDFDSGNRFWSSW